jgi:hypothetical protein
MSARHAWQMDPRALKRMVEDMKRLGFLLPVKTDELAHRWCTQREAIASDPIVRYRNNTR